MRHVGHASRVYGMIKFELSPFEQKAFHGFLKDKMLLFKNHFIPLFPWCAPPVIISYMVYDWAEKEHDKFVRKNPKDFENELFSNLPMNQNNIFVELTVDVGPSTDVIPDLSPLDLKNHLDQNRKRSPSFCTEIDFRSIELLESIGSGSYNTEPVYKARWNGRTVAVKIIDSETHKRETFLIEVKHLSQVSHENIIKFYGSNVHSPAFFVMEFAADGSLFDLLHQIKPSPAYKAGHAVSWALQCAQGVDYLHKMTPALVHRDLKPGNLLLTDSARHLKICDFGTVCNLQTYMTNNQGSASYMAPEVFEGKSYTEKCDVFSWSIILWEVLARCKPFEDLEIAYRIMWAVKDGRRPASIKNCPECLQILMENCWDPLADKRPSMTDVVRRIKCILRLFPGYDEPILIPKRENRNYLRYANFPTYHLGADESHLLPCGAKLGCEVNVAQSAPASSSNSTESSPLPTKAVKSPSVLSLGDFPPISEDSVSNSATEQKRNGSIDPFDKDNFITPVNDLYTVPADYKPLKPIEGCEESVNIYEEHVNLLTEYMQLQQESNLLSQQRAKLIQDLEDREKIVSTRSKLQQEKAQLTEFRDLLKDQLRKTHKDPDYSCAYVILETEDANLSGHGFAFTLGRGTEIVVSAIRALCPIVDGQKVASIVSNFRQFYRGLTNESQLRWLGPEKGVIHLATAAVINAIWDLWAKIENKPVWKLLVDLEPADLVAIIDFTYITDVLTEEKALNLLQKNKTTTKEREHFILKNGLPGYITSVGWMGFSDDKIKQLCEEATQDGWTCFKMKVGCGVENDARRAQKIRDVIGNSNKLMMDANQVWNVDDAIINMEQLKQFEPLWIEEPTSPDDVLGHKAISQALKKYNIGVATGEHCQNRVMFKQFLQSGAMQFCQIDACRVGGVNELLAILLLAANFQVPVCPHAGGVGLCELVVHLAAFNYICVSPSLDNVMIEYVDHLHEHFIDPVLVENARYKVPLNRLYSNLCNIRSLKRNRFLNHSSFSSLDMEDNGEHNLALETDERLRIEDKYLPELIQEIVCLSNFKRNGSLLVVGGGSWHFAKAVWEASTLPTCVYADGDQISLRSADQEEETLTVECDVTKTDEILKLGKYDGIVVKDAFEHLFLDPGEEDLKEQITEYMAALYKILKYSGRALLIFRPNPSKILPLPKEISSKFSSDAENLNFDLLKSCASENEFEIKHKTLNYPVCIDKSDYGKILAKSTGTLLLAKRFFELNDDENNYVQNFIDDRKEESVVQFDDKLDLILLTKEILDD